ncbi:MAG: hypothetical protein SGI87_08555 [Flavobacteriales bacterium]|nr:hypothetical protein [Flavobacteriales bacterium]
MLSAQKDYRKPAERFKAQYEYFIYEDQIPFGWYNARHVFYSGLKYEVQDPTTIPYPRIDSLFGLIEESILILKEITDTAEHLRFQKFKGKSQKNRALLYADSLKNKFDETITPLRLHQQQFDSLCKLFAIKKWLMREYADTLSPLIEAMGDSLVLQGKLIALELRKAAATFPDKKSDGYKKQYKPISELQAAHKVFGQTLTQLENSQTRFYDSNPEDFYYTGPSISPRKEAEATQQVIVQLNFMMDDFRKLQSQMPRNN